MLYPVFLLLLFVPLIIILLLRVNIVVEYVRNNEDDNITISFYTLKELLKYKLEIPLIDVGSKGVEYKLVRERGRKNTATGDKKKKTKSIEFIQRIYHIWELSKSKNESVCRIRCFIKKNVVFDEFRLNVKEGTGDAAATGLINGILWALSGVFISFLFRLFRVKSKKYKSEIKIEPDYKVSCFNVDLFCIFHTKLVHIILIIMAFLLQRIGSENNIKKEAGGEING